MTLSPFHAMYTAHELYAYRNADKLAAVYASSDIEVYPYQVAAALFALRSPYLKGVVLADEGSLGKTYEALLVISQLWYEGKERLLVIVPTPLLGQWVEIMEKGFSVPFVVIDNNERYAEIGSDNPFYQTAAILTTYDFAVQKADDIHSIAWNAVVFDEAHRINNHENKTTVTLKEAVGDAYKILLTATPMQNSIMDLYGLLNFIDDSVLGDADIFYKTYFRKPENYHDLTKRISRHCFRTLRSQVETYVKIPRRLLATIDYQPNKQERQLAVMVEAYLQKPNKTAFPEMEPWRLALTMWRALASSTFAFTRFLKGAVRRSNESELLEMLELSEVVETNAKGLELLKAIKKAFPELKKRGANRKALIFTEDRETQSYLVRLLEAEGYNVLEHNGSKSRNYDIMRRFEQEADILIATDTVAEGFNLAFCSFVINYDIPYNALTLEQRIMRCHRMGQQSDMVVLNFLSSTGMADTRKLQLINKRILQFDGIMGMSDDVVGNFSANVKTGLDTAFAAARNKAEIERDFEAILATHESENMDAVQEAENLLFTTFTRDIAQSITITPQYIKDRTEEINAKLWALTKWFFHGKQGYRCIDETRTLKVGFTAQKVFTGTRIGRYEYSIDDRTLPKSGRLTVMSPLTRSIISEIFWRGVQDRGTVEVADLDDPCYIGYYAVKVIPNGRSWEATNYPVFVGKTAWGDVLTDEDCRRLMELPVLRFTSDGERHGEMDINNKSRHELDDMVNTEAIIRRATIETDEARRDEISHVQDRAYRQKQALSREISALKNQMLQIEKGLAQSKVIADQIDAEKKKVTSNLELRKREQTLFLEEIKLDAEAEKAVEALIQEANMTAQVKRLFAIKVTGGTTNG